MDLSVVLHKDPNSRAIVLIARGRLDRHTAGELRDSLRRTIKSFGCRIVLDLSSVHGVDFAGVAVLVTASREARAKGGWLRLAAPTAHATELIRAAGCADQLTISGCVDDALRTIDLRRAAPKLDPVRPKTARA
jgi:anti-sigma B factor antagonist